MHKQPQHAAPAHAFAKHLGQRKEEQRQRKDQALLCLLAKAKEGDARPDQREQGRQRENRPTPIAVSAIYLDLQREGEESKGASLGQAGARAIRAKEDLPHTEQGYQQCTKGGKSIQSSHHSALAANAIRQQHAQQHAQSAAQEGNAIDIKPEQLLQGRNTIVFKIQLLHQQGIGNACQHSAEDSGENQGKAGNLPRATPQFRHRSGFCAAQAIQSKNDNRATCHQPKIG